MQNGYFLYGGRARSARHSEATLLVHRSLPLGCDHAHSALLRSLVALAPLGNQQLIRLFKGQFGAQLGYLGCWFSEMQTFLEQRNAKHFLFTKSKDFVEPQNELIFGSF